MDWLEYYKVRAGDVIICMEHTGLYTYCLIDFMVDAGMHIWVEMPLRIKKSMGLQRGGDAGNRSPFKKLKLKLTTKSQIEKRRAGT